jgi:DNA-binding TFAR19-related protein (PDSD5 family)
VKLATVSKVSKSASHNFRDKKTLNADPLQTHKNEFEGSISSDELLTKLDERLATVKTVRKNAVRCVEFLITASPEFFKIRKGDRYLNEAKQWLNDKFGADNVLNFTVHRDETSPHLIAYVVPIDKKGNLNARAFFGGSAKMTALQDEFNAKVAKKYELKRGLRGSKAKHEQISDYYKRVNTPTPDLSFFDAKASYKAENAKRKEAEAKAKKMERERVKLAEKNQSLQNQVNQFFEDEKLTRLASARLIKNAFSKAELSKMFNVEIVGKQDIFDALIRSGKANNFSNAVALCASKIRSEKSDWDETVKFVVDLEDKPSQNLALQSSTMLATKIKRI